MRRKTSRSEKTPRSLPESSTTQTAPTLRDAMNSAASCTVAEAFIEYGSRSRMTWRMSIIIEPPGDLLELLGLPERAKATKADIRLRDTSGGSGPVPVSEVAWSVLPKANGMSIACGEPHMPLSTGARQMKL